MTIPTTPGGRAERFRDTAGATATEGENRDGLLPPLMPELAVYLALLALGALSVALAFVGAFGALAILACLAVSFVMAVPVTMVFMHLRGAMTVVVLAGLAGLIWLAVLFALTLADYVTRPGALGSSVRTPAQAETGRDAGMGE